MENQKTNLINKFKALSRNQKIFFIIAIVVLLGVINKSNNNNSSSSDYSAPSNSSSSPSTTPSFTCKNCGRHSFHYHETVTDMKVCNSCGAGN